MAKRVVKGLGWLPDLPDHRDLLYRAVLPRVTLPTTTDLRNDCSAIEDQGKIGSCTAQALAANLEFLDNRDDHVYTDVSRLFLYYNERVLFGMPKIDAGAYLRDGVKTLHQDGICAEKSWPYIEKQFAVKPPAKCYKEAKAHTISSYFRILGLPEMLACLADGYPFVFGFTMYSGFYSDKVAKTGVLDMPKKGEGKIGGHAVMAVGYDRDKQRFLIRNSWGKNWGQKGYFTIPFEYLETLAADFWTVRK